MSKIAKFKELSFLVYGLGLSGRSVINFFKKKKLSNFTFGMIIKSLHSKGIDLRI